MQDTTQKILIFGMVILVLAVVISWLIKQRNIYCSKTENYSPYRGLNKKEFEYLPSYNEQDYYRKYPYIFPMPNNYYRNIIKLERDSYDEDVNNKNELNFLGYYS